MSFQAYKWACDQIWGGPSARATIFAIANYANDRGFCYPKQDTLARESEQSIDTVQRRIADFIERGLVRRVKLARFGRRTHDFLILKCSELFDAPMEVIEAFIPRGCDIMGDDKATADCGSDRNVTGTQGEQESEINDLAAESGVTNSSQPQSAAITLPQRAVDATALVRQQEAVIEPKEDSPLPPKGGVSDQNDREEETEPDGWPEFKSGFEADGVPITRPSIAMREYGLVSRDQRKLLNQAARGLIAHRSRERRPTGKPSAQTFIRERDAWHGWAKLAPPELVSMVEHPRGSEAYRAAAVYRMLLKREQKHEPIWKGPATPVPRFMALAQFADHVGVVDRTDWIELDAKAQVQQIAAWRNLIKEWSGEWVSLEEIPVIDPETGLQQINRKEWNGRTLDFPVKREVLRVPAPWPPRKDGSFSKSGDDPPDEHAA